MHPPGRVRSDLIVLGVGNPLRGDDSVGLVVVRRLNEVFGPSLAAFETYEADPVLAERIAAFEELLIVDALPASTSGEDAPPFRLFDIEPGESVATPGGFVSHVFDWGSVLALARDLFGHCPRARLIGIAACCFELSETLSPLCALGAEEALRFLASHCIRETAGQSEKARREAPQLPEARRRKVASSRMRSQTGSRRSRPEE